MQNLIAQYQAKIVLCEEQDIPENVLSGSDVPCIKECIEEVFSIQKDRKISFRAEEVFLHYVV